MRAWGHWGDLNDPADGTRMTRDGGGSNGAGVGIAEGRSV